MQYQARWVTRQRAEDLRKHRGLGGALLLDVFNGYIIVEPVGSDLGDGQVLSHQEAEYELQPVWHQGPAATLREARRRLGLEAGALSGVST
jgi:hypothetical protein